MVLPTLPPIVVNPPETSINLEEVNWNANGTVTFHWSPILGAVKYRLEIADDDLTKIRVLTETEDSVRTVTVPPSGVTRYVRLTAIFKDAHEMVGHWFPITRDLAPRRR